jgi:hypothetical protein
MHRDQPRLPRERNLWLYERRHAVRRLHAATLREQRLGEPDRLQWSHARLSRQRYLRVCERRHAVRRLNPATLREQRLGEPDRVQRSHAPVCLGNGTCGCTNGATQCVGSTPQRCVNNAWVNQSTCSGDTPVCSAGNCVCTENETRCTGSGGSGRVQCRNGSWQTATSCSGTTPVCHGNGSCGCEPGAARCESPNQVATCSANRTWNVTTCPDYRACDGRNCVASAGLSGLVTCDPHTVCGAGEQCCYNSTAQEGECQPAAPVGTTCATSESLFEIDCDGPNDCGSSEVCCNVAYMRFVNFCSARSDCTGTGASVVCNLGQGAQNNPACTAGQTCAVSGGSATPYLAFCR